MEITKSYTALRPLHPRSQGLGLRGRKWCKSFFLISQVVYLVLQFGEIVCTELRAPVHSVLVPSPSKRTEKLWLRTLHPQQ